ncbi:hypothetical protein BO94DRAFT_133464 [Aspergillus sclerotioniger CBS 115572]|uniref:Secreted protein n=1 Tax=Aspergillus sclerotioniger CBS 115572 TaxID=1450535 RepID=A0A317XBB4_9EURO|nr:hypothetical protein BO94DRAFT_133464 [Aspergillus sclerotioniger CBS 115572]PWY95685.1 hypothetical protein BO94DRAFT_133464 [Aspergillus sclerotioniger CBS 115572]
MRIGKLCYALSLHLQALGGGGGGGSSVRRREGKGKRGKIIIIVDNRDTNHGTMHHITDGSRSVVFPSSFAVRMARHPEDMSMSRCQPCFT